MKASIFVLSHVAVGLMGWGLASVFRSPPPSPDPRPTVKTERPGSFHRDADELVQRIRSDLAKQAAAEAKKVPPEILLREKFRGRLATLDASEDPAASFREALAAARDEDSGITAGAWFVLWAQADPAAALQFARQEGLNSLASEHVHMACEMAGELLPPETLLPLLETETYLRDDFLRGMARTQLTQRPVQQLANLITGSSKELRSSLEYHFKSQWPATRLDDFGRFVTALDAPKMLNYGSNQWSKEEFSAWLLRFAEHHPDPDFVHRLKNGSGYAPAVADNTSLPMETRIGVLLKSTTHRFHGMDLATARQDILESISRREVINFLSPDDGPDLLHAFHHGRTDASELLDKLASRFPTYAEADVLRGHLHRELYSDDPVRAAILLKPLSEKERTKIMVERFDDALFGSPLETIRNALELLPKRGDEDADAARAESFYAIVDHGLDDYGPDYLDWIATLPDPADRRDALAGITRRIEGSMQVKAREIRRIVGDTSLPPSD